MTFPPQQGGFNPSQPTAGGGGGDSFEPRDHQGVLLLVFPKNYTPEATTKNGVTSQADADIIAVDRLGPDGRPLSFINARLFGNLANSVRNDIGGQVLGRLGQGPNTRGTPPWILTNFTDQEVQMATPVHAAYMQGQFKPTEQQMQTPATAPSYAPPQTQAWNAAAPPNAAPPQQQWQQPPTPAPAAGAPAQQWQGAPVAAPAAAPAAQWNAPAPAPAPQQTAPAPQQAPAPAAGQWNAPAAAPAPAPTPVPPPAAAAPVNPDLVAFLASRGVTVTPDMSQAQCESIASSFPS